RRRPPSRQPPCRGQGLRRSPGTSCRAQRQRNGMVRQQQARRSSSATGVSVRDTATLPSRSLALALALAFGFRVVRTLLPQAREILGGYRAGDVVSGEARGIEKMRLPVPETHGILEIVQILVHQPVRADQLLHFLDRASRCDELV